MIKKSKLSKGMTCSMDKLEDHFSAEEPNDESYHNKEFEDQMNLDKSEIRKKYFENIEQFFEQLEMKLQMRYQHRL
jgi:hypothetical protein